MKTTTKRSARVKARPKEEKRMIYVVGEDDVLQAELTYVECPGQEPTAYHYVLTDPLGHVALCRDCKRSRDLAQFYEADNSGGAVFATCLECRVAEETKLRHADPFAYVARCASCKKAKELTHFYQPDNYGGEIFVSCADCRVVEATQDRAAQLYKEEVAMATEACASYQCPCGATVLVFGREYHDQTKRHHAWQQQHEQKANTTPAMATEQDESVPLPVSST